MKLNGKEYKEVKIKKMIINGKEQEGSIIKAEDTTDKQELNITLYTQNSETVVENKGGHRWFYELLQKVIFYNKRK